MCLIKREVHWFSAGSWLWCFFMYSFSTPLNPPIAFIFYMKLYTITSSYFVEKQFWLNKSPLQRAAPLSTLLNYRLGIFKDFRILLPTIFMYSTPLSPPSLSLIYCWAYQYLIDDICSDFPLQIVLIYILSHCFCQLPWAEVFSS